MPKRAVIFTHVGTNPATLEERSKALSFLEDQQETFEAYLQCPDIGLVYVYASAGVEQYIKSLSDDAKIEPLELMRRSARILGLLELAHIRAERRLKRAATNPQAPTAPTRIRMFGLQEVAHLLHMIQQMRPDLVRRLAGGSGKYTYDSPKFFEAVIRIVRGVDPLLAANAILRFDHDVKVNNEAIAALLREHEKLLDSHERFYYFSGGYGGNGVHNDHPVRVHWLVNPDGNGGYTLPREARVYLRDLTEIAAAQEGVEDVTPTTGVAASPSPRKSPQVVSGAGLSMSLRAVFRLPPFMNAGANVIWVDDHLKRRLHEAIGDISPLDVERVEARVRQDRHPKGIQSDEITGARNYFPSVLRGCILHALILKPDGDRGPLSSAIADGITRGTAALGADEVRNKVREDMSQVASEQARRVLGIWTAAKYGSGTSGIGRNLLETWAQEYTEVGKLSGIVSESVDIAMDYLDLFFEWWRLFVEAILRIRRGDAPWLFLDAD